MADAVERGNSVLGISVSDSQNFYDKQSRYKNRLKGRL